MLKLPFNSGRRKKCLALAALILVQAAGFCFVYAGAADKAVAVSSQTAVPVFTATSIIVSSSTTTTVIVSSPAAAPSNASFSPVAGVSYKATSIVVSSCTTTTIFISSSTSITISTCAMTTQEKLEQFREKLPEMKVQETVISVSPKMRIYLPSGAFDLNLKQEYRQTTLDFNTKYDFVNEIMGYGLDLLYNISPLAIGINFADNVNFDQIYSGTQYLQRSQSVTPYVQEPIAKYTKIRTSMRFENTYTDAVSSNFVLDQGKNILGEIGVWNDSITESTSAPTGGSASVLLQHSFQNLGSNYNYTQAELNYRRFYKVFKSDFIEFEFQSGYPIEVSNRPLNSFYFLGGYRILRGYNFQEFTGDSKLYAAIKYNIPLNKVTEQEFFERISVSMFTWNFFAEGAKIGTKDIFTTPSDPKFSAGTGIGYKIVLFRLFPVKLELSVAKAFEARPVGFYFTVSTLYYTWRNQ